MHWPASARCSKALPHLLVSLLACASGAQAGRKPLLRLLAVVRGMSDHSQRTGWHALSAWGAAVVQLAVQAHIPVSTPGLQSFELDLCPLPGDNVMVSFSNKDSRDFTCKVSLLEHAPLTNITMQLSKDLGWSALPCLHPASTYKQRCVCLLAGGKLWLQPCLHRLGEAGAANALLCRPRAPHEGPAHQGRPSMLGGCLFESAPPERWQHTVRRLACAQACLCAGRVCKAALASFPLAGRGSSLLAAVHVVTHSLPLSPAGS